MHKKKAKIGHIIKKYREKNNLSQRTLAKRMGHTATFISLIESDKRGASVITIQKLVKILKIPSNLLLNTNITTSETVNNFFNEFGDIRFLSEKEQNVILLLVDVLKKSR